MTSFSVAQAATEIKVAILAPEGSTWAKVMHEWNDELKQRTEGRLSLKLYPGGVLGDELDVIRKIRIGQCHAGGFTGVGLGAINAEVRVLELPFLFENYTEVDAVSKKIAKRLESGFEKKGFILLGWTETGFVNIFSKKPIASSKDMKGMKMWAWEGDPLVEALYQQFGIVPTPLTLPDVLTSLQTGLIDAVYAPPLAAIALQWFTRTPYLTKENIGYSLGGFLIDKKFYLKLPAADRDILQDTATKFSRILVERTRQDNEASYTSLHGAGLKFISIPPKAMEEIRTTSKNVWEVLAGKLYSTELLREVQTTLTHARGGS